MTRWTVLGLVVMALGLLVGCSALAGLMGDPSKAGSTVTTIGGVVAGANPLVGLILAVVGGGLTAFGEAKKTAEGR